MKLYLLTQAENCNYDTYDSCIVCTKDVEDAKTIGPNGKPFFGTNDRYSSWARTLRGVTCKEIGIANNKQKRGVIIASFNAG